MAYRHTQIGTFSLAFLGGGALVLLLLSTRFPWDAMRAVLFCLLLVAALAFGSMTVAIQGSTLEVIFGPGLIRKRIRLDELISARRVRNRWWYGWGVRRLPQGWLFNVSGLNAVELRLVGGRTYLIGTDQPAELMRAIRAAVPGETVSLSEQSGS